MGIWDYFRRKKSGVASAWQSNKQIKQQQKAASQPQTVIQGAAQSPPPGRSALWKNRGRMVGSATLAGGAAIAGAGYGLWRGGKWTAEKGAQGYQKTKQVVQDFHYGHRYDVLLILSLIWYFIFGIWSRGTLAGRFSANIAFVLFIYFFVLSPSDRRDKGTLSLMAIFFIVEVFLPAFASMSPLLMTNKWIVNYLLNPQITLLWFYFGLIKGDGGTLIQKFFRIAVFFLLVYKLMTIAPVITQFENIQTPMTPEQLAKAESLYVSAYKWWKDMALNFGKVMRQGKDYWYYKFYYPAIGGDLYSGTIDEKQKDTLGVFIKNIKPATSEFMYGEQVSVWALLEAKTLEDGLTVNLACFHGQKDKDGKYPNPGTAIPPVIPLIYSDEQRDIDCRYYGMQEGSNKATIQADFNFETMAYLKTYFIDQDRLRGLQRNGIDPLDEYFIEDKKPTARFTNGPVMVGMGSVDPPIAISATTTLEPRLGVTLTTNTGWKGRIKQIEELTLMVPDTMSLDLGSCTTFKEVPNTDYVTKCMTGYQKYRTKQFLDCISQSGVNQELAVNANTGMITVPSDKKAAVDSCMKTYCENEIKSYKAYQLIIDDTTKGYYANIGMDVPSRPYRTFDCRVKIESRERLLGNMPISVQYFRAKARYTYQIEESTNVNIKALPVDPFTSQVPKPPSSERINENIAYIYSQYYSKYPFIKEACTKSGLFDGGQKCFCMVAAIMAKESGGNLAVKDGTAGEVSLMQITDGAINDVRSKYPTLATCINKRDPACNVLLGTLYLKSISELSNAQQQPQTASLKVDSTVVPANIAAGYNCGPKALFVTANCNGMLNWECPAAQNTNTQKCLYNGAETTRLTYVPYVLERYKTCMNLNLQNTVVVQTPSADENIMKEGSIAINNGEKKRIDNTPYWIEKMTSDPSIYLASIYYGTAADKIVKVVYPMQLPVDKWQWDQNYPLIALKREGTGTTLTYRYLAKIASKEITLTQNKKKDVGGTQTNDITEVFPKWIYAYYDSSNLYLYDQSSTKKICTVPWSNYAQRTVGLCTEPKMLGFRIINKDTYDPSQLTNPIAGAVGYATVQVQFDPNAEHACCSDCTSCNQLSDKEVLCSSCKDCVTNGVLGTTYFATCEKKSS
jgi:hypothetical protein